MELVAAAFGDDVDDAAGAGAVLGGEGVGQHGHLLHGGERDVGEDGLAAPAVVAGAAIDFEPGLAAAGAVGGEEVLVHEDVALVDGGAVGGVEQRQEGEAAIEQRRLRDLDRLETGAELRLVGSDIAGGARTVTSVLPPATFSSSEISAVLPPASVTWSLRASAKPCFVATTS